MKQLICITGIDGVGKSTLIKGIKEKYPTSCVANIWDLFKKSGTSGLFNSKMDIDNFLCQLSADSRLLFLSHALKYSIDYALKSEANIIIIDSYFYKYFATELALNASSALVDDLRKIFPKPNLTIELKLTIEEAANRKVDFSRYECGLSKSPGHKSFIKFQIQALKNWEGFKQSNWVEIDASIDFEKKLENILDLIKKLC